MRAVSIAAAAALALASIGGPACAPRGAGVPRGTRPEADPCTAEAGHVAGREERDAGGPRAPEGPSTRRVASGPRRADAERCALERERAARAAVQRRTTELGARIAGWPPELAAIWYACREFRACKRSGDEACLAATLRDYEAACREYERKEGVVPGACDTSVNACPF